MTLTTRRPVSELPGDPGTLSLEYRLSDDEQTDALWPWRVSVLARRRKVGSFTFYRLLDDGRGAALGAAELEDLGLYNTVLPFTSWTGGGVEADFRDRVTRPSPDLLVMWEARLDPAWRGFGLGPVLAAEAIETLATGCCAVLTCTVTRERPADASARSPEEYRRGEAALAATWQQVGFRYDGSRLLGMLDPAGADCRRSREHLRARRAALADADRAG
jgi:GNAT superfamily N-acetyltransferase